MSKNKTFTEKAFYNDLVLLAKAYGIESEVVEGKNYSSKMVIPLGMPKKKTDLGNGKAVQGNVSLYEYSPDALEAIAVKYDHTKSPKKARKQVKAITTTKAASDSAKETLQQCIKDLIGVGLSEVQATALVYGSNA